MYTNRNLCNPSIRHDMGHDLHIELSMTVSLACALLRKKHEMIFRCSPTTSLIHNFMSQPTRHSL